ncbi:hypothetical protein KLP40_16195 [Hymenobacter sp. NST-14]|uniref:hypothetical protein n=1 Tax=Hymenobacter piscis TaxID=2839984 RepID=UPI001C01F1CE|nr:hypothetical protein [Hymenobacter piscis]MBT9394713.1 hypothetical protein [Hymenobacter piscis]
MYQKVTRILLLCLLVVGTHAAVAQSKVAYQYMQLFYYGSKTMAGPVGHFSPALRGQTDIALASPTAYMKLITARMEGPSATTQLQADTDTASGERVALTVIDLTKMTPAQRKQYAEQERKREEQEQLERRQNLEEFARLTTDHTKALTDKVTQSLNAAAADGWEVVQMSSFGAEGGVVYLLRKAR